MKEAHLLKILIILKVKKGTFSSFLMFMVDRVKSALGLIVLEQFKEYEFLIDQLFFAISAKNNKLTRINWTYIQIINHAKYK